MWTAFRTALSVSFLFLFDWLALDPVEPCALGHTEAVLRLLGLAVLLLHDLSRHISAKKNNSIKWQKSHKLRTYVTEGGGLCLDPPPHLKTL